MIADVCVATRLAGRREDEREKYVVMCRGALHLILTADNYYVTQAFNDSQFKVRHAAAAKTKGIDFFAPPDLAAIQFA
jgi:hypothetical protein